jgi:hypothetical protein
LTLDYITYAQRRYHAKQQRASLPQRPIHPHDVASQLVARMCSLRDQSHSTDDLQSVGWDILQLSPVLPGVFYPLIEYVVLGVEVDRSFGLIHAASDGLHHHVPSIAAIDQPAAGIEQRSVHLSGSLAKQDK